MKVSESIRLYLAHHKAASETNPGNFFRKTSCLHKAIIHMLLKYYWPEKSYKRYKKSNSFASTSQGLFCRHSLLYIHSFVSYYSILKFQKRPLKEVPPNSRLLIWQRQLKTTFVGRLAILQDIGEELVYPWR